MLLILVPVAVIYAAIGMLPLFGGPGYESALALGFIAPGPMSVSCSLATLRWRAAGAPPLSALGRSTLWALGFSCVAVAITWLHGLRVGLCDSWNGIALLLLGPVSGCLLAAGWGTAVGVLLGGRSRRWHVALALAGPLGGVGLSVWRFYTSPMIFAFDPFVGYFAGTLYDTVIVAIPRLLTYRIGSLGTCVAVSAAFVVGRLRWKDLGGQRGWIVGVGVAGLIASLTVWWKGPALGHYQNVATIRAELPGSKTSERCEIVFGRATSQKRAALFLKECDAHIRHHEEFFGVHLKGRVTAFVFDSSAQKGALMGAARTYIAKPWRSEVYVQTGNFPHPVLGHELAHIVTGALARGPLKVAGALGGWIPDPGRIEGFAVAAAPAENSEFDLMTWSSALRKINRLPRLSNLFELGFFNQNSSQAYTVAGSFVSWLRAEVGVVALQRWYAGENLSVATGGRPFADLERKFLAALDVLPVSSALIRAARSRFERPAIFSRSCPHDVDRLLQQAGEALSQSRWLEAETLYQEAHALDPSRLSGKLGLASCRRKQGDLSGAIGDLEKLLARQELVARQRAAVQERLGDRLFQAGRYIQARKRYGQALSAANDEGRRRTLDVKMAATDGWGRTQIAGLLLGDPVDGVDRMSASADLGRWSENDPTAGLPDYLLAKNLYATQNYRAAELHLRRSLARPSELESVRRESLRIGTFLACALENRAAVQSRGQTYDELPGVSKARRAGMKRFVRRCLDNG